MGFGIIDTSILTAIANAIRTKLGVQTTYKPSEMATAIGQISGGGITPTGTKEITANGTNIDVASYAYADVTVPNSYSQSDEGKVVSNGALVAQTAHAEVTQNGTIDTTLNNSVTVNVRGGGSSGLVYETGTYTAAADGNPYISFTNSHTSAPSIIVFMDVSTSYIGTTAGTQYGFFDYVKLFGTNLKTSNTLQRDGAYQWARVGGSNASTTLGSAILSDTTTQVTSSGFTPNFNTNSYKCKSGQTYKWIAIWAPTS